MAEAIDTQRALSYQVFVDHDHFIEHGRHKRIVLKNTFSEDFRSVGKFPEAYSYQEATSPNLGHFCHYHILF